MVKHRRARRRRAPLAVAATLAAASIAVPAHSQLIDGRPTVPADGWRITVYYTPVERFYSGPEQSVTGCPELDCVNGDSPLGSYPTSFLDVVRHEGAGKTNTGRYLHWAHNVGWWLDEAPRDALGGTLEPYVSAAADADVLPVGARVSVRDCGRDASGGAIPDEVCARMSAARWRVVDQFTPGWGGERHLDAYIGEQTGADVTDNPFYTTLHQAELSVSDGAR